MGIFPVVHIKTPEQSLEQTRVAVEAGADGVFLINHNVSRYDETNPLVDSFNMVKGEYPGLFVGINFLSEDPLGGYDKVQKMIESGELAGLPDALWFDDAVDGIRDESEAFKYLRHVQRYREVHPALKNVLFYGGVSFKYTGSYSEDPNRSADMAQAFGQYIDVVTTSGSGTGHSPSPEKIRTMKQAPNVARLAVASGISVENIKDYEGSVDDILVSSSVETEPYSGIFVPDKVAELVQAAHQN